MIRTLAGFAAACDGQLIGEDRPFAELVIDSRASHAGDLFAALPGERVDGHRFVADAAAHGAAGALVRRKQRVVLPQIVVDSVEQAMARAARRARAAFAGPLVGVAGSNGKTTAKEMIAAILSQAGECLATRGNLNNHLGVPMTLLRLRDQHASAVIEMGANRAGDVAQLVQIARPTAGLITNAGAEHLEGFGTLEGVARAEGEMVATLPGEASAILNADDPFLSLWRSSTQASVVTFGLAREAQFRAEGLHLSVDAAGFSSVFSLLTPQGRCEIRLALAGEHNVRNALGAAAAAASAGASLEQIRAGLAAVRAVKGRLQLRRRRGGAWLIDDSYNANPSSVRVGLEVLRDMPGRRWLVLGDMAELGEAAAQSHRELGELASTMGVERLYTYGSLAALAAENFGAGAHAYQDAQALTQALESDLQADVCLLVKGSRVNRLERIVEALAPEKLSEPGRLARQGRALSMLYWVAKLLAVHHSVFHVFSYLTLRAILTVASALCLSLLVGPSMISRLSRYQIGQVVRREGPASHLPKAGTPTMGGALIIVAIAISTLLWADLRNRFVWVALAVTVGFGLIGFYDDYLKLVVGNSRGLIARWKYFWQSLLGIGAAIVLFKSAHAPAETDFFVPFIKTVSVPLGATGYLLITYFMIVGMSNAVNLTDGLDGLAIMPAVLLAAGLGLFAYASGNEIFARYLAIPAIPQAGELLIFCSALGGAGLGFLWFNSYPAQVFMGDIGALALGAALGLVAVVVRQEIVCLVMGGIFVLETASVILQVASFKLTGRRIFRMAPIHHHFELKGWAEPKVIVRFWIISLLLVLAGLSTLKLR